MCVCVKAAGMWYGQFLAVSRNLTSSMGRHRDHSIFPCPLSSSLLLAYQHWSDPCLLQCDPIALLMVGIYDNIRLVSFSSTSKKQREYSTQRFCLLYTWFHPNLDVISMLMIFAWSLSLLQHCVHIHTQQNSYSISHLLGTVTTQWLNSNCVVTIVNCGQHSDYRVYWLCSLRAAAGSCQ